MEAGVLLGEVSEFMKIEILCTKKSGDSVSRDYNLPIPDYS